MSLSNPPIAGPPPAPPAEPFWPEDAASPERAAGSSFAFAMDYSLRGQELGPLDARADQTRKAASERNERRHNSSSLAHGLPKEAAIPHGRTKLRIRVKAPTKDSPATAPAKQDKPDATEPSGSEAKPLAEKGTSASAAALDGPNPIVLYAGLLTKVFPAPFAPEQRSQQVASQPAGSQVDPAATFAPANPASVATVQEAAAMSQAQSASGPVAASGPPAEEAVVGAAAQEAALASSGGLPQPTPASAIPRPQSNSNEPILDAVNEPTASPIDLPINVVLHPAGLPASGAPVSLAPSPSSYPEGFPIEPEPLRPQADDQLKADGISAAKVAAGTMQPMDDRNKLAQLGTSAESLLAPAPMRLAGALTFPPWVKEPAGAPPQKAAATGQEIAGTPMLPSVSALRLEDRPPEIPAPSGTAAAAHAQELVSQVLNHVTELRQLNLNSLVVVLKPDANTEILLRLEQRGGAVEIQARFERGDFQNFNAHWQELQRSLAGQGVRLSPLENSPFNAAASFHRPTGGFSQPRDGQSVPSPAREAAIEPARARPVKPQPSASVSRRWESWA